MPKWAEYLDKEIEQERTHIQRIMPEGHAKLIALEQLAFFEARVETAKMYDKVERMVKFK